MDCDDFRFLRVDFPMPLGGSFQRKSCFRQKKEPKKELPLNCPIDVIPLGWEGGKGNHSKLGPQSAVKSEKCVAFSVEFFLTEQEQLGRKNHFL
jgi:hypothetical protein